MLFEVLSAGALGLYFFFLLSFSFVSHPLGYCVLLVGGALSLSFMSVLCWGFSWYMAIFILVYVGGVYVLFLFISVHNANSFPEVGGTTGFYAFLFFSSCFFTYFFIDPLSLVEEGSRFLCGSGEGFSYLILCFTLLIGFVGVSVVSSHKDSFFR